MLLSNAYRPDPRVRREALFLRESGFDVTLICWDRRIERRKTESEDGVRIIRIQDVTSDYAVGWRQMFRLPRFWRQAESAVVDIEADIVHCHDLDTLLPGVRIKRRLGCPLIYDCHEPYPELMQQYLPGILCPMLKSFEERLLRFADHVVTIGPRLGKRLHRSGARHVSVVGNYADLEQYQSVDRYRVEDVRARLRSRPDELLVGYIGSFSKNRLLLPLLRAAPLVPDAHFHIWGGGLQKASVVQAADRFPNTTYHGWLHSIDVPTYLQALDVVFHGLRVEFPATHYAAPNTLFQAMASARPIIVSPAGEACDIVQEEQCGIVLSDQSSEAIAGAVRELSSASLRSAMGERGLRAAQEKYNSRQANEKLFAAYAGLLGQELRDLSLT
jgi:glycosyltransferase involved in cell wall biosynthesis